MKYSIPLTLGTNYVSHWNEWEAIRELLQNALDQDDHTWWYEDNELHIQSLGAILTDDMLLMGCTSKADDSNSRGLYGEGFKLSLLILARLGYDVNILTGSRIWSPCIREHEQLGKDCLHIDVQDTEDVGEYKAVHIVIKGLSEDIINEVYLKYLFMDDQEIVATDGKSTCFVQDKPRLYVGGLYVCDLEAKYGKEYRYSYDLHQSTVKLDRDRSTCDNFYIARAATQIFVDAKKWEPLAELAADECLDISDYTSLYVTDVDVKTAMEECAKHVFMEKHDEDTIPINASLPCEEKALLRKEALSINKVTVEVKPVLFEMLPDDVTDVPENEELRKSIAEKLEGWLEFYCDELSNDAYDQLKEIIADEKILRGE